MAGKDSGPSIVSIALLGGAAYLAYQFFFASSTSAAASAGPPTTPPAGGSTPALPAPPAASPAQPGFNSLDTIYQRLAAKLSSVNDPAVTQSGTAAIPDVFNFYLGQVSSFQLPASAMGQLFGPEPQASTTLANFWSAASGWLAQNKGLSGFGGRGLAGIFATAGRRR